MLGFLPAPLTGIIVGTLLLANLLFWAVPVYILILLKLITWGRVRVWVSRMIANTAQTWAALNVWMWTRLLSIEWDVRGVENLSREGKYLVVCNHQTWNDIPMLMTAFDRQVPFFKFFIKQQLIWVPILGLVWWGLDFPFMRRHTREQIAKNPALRGQDLETTRKACAKYRHQPVTILNFMEGTRFTPEKQAAQKSPYENLLKPRAGGMALVLAAMGEQLDAMLDVTIYYPHGGGGFWDLTCGRLRSVVMEVRRIEIPQEFIGRSDVSSKKVQAWVSGLWREKDQRLNELREQAKNKA